MALSERILLPLANETDAERTCEAVAKTFGDEATESTIVVTHVIEKGGGTPDKAPLSAREQQAESIFSLAENFLESEGFTVETELRYGTDVVDELTGAAEEMAVTSIVFLPRESGGLLSKLLAGDLSEDLLSEASVPVVVLPQQDS